jgi:sugar phosphate isomerase/epimerase
MPVSEIRDISKLCIHTITTKHWSLKTAIEKYSEKDVKGITIWRQALEGIKLTDANGMIKDNDMQVVSICRGGFFPSTDNKVRAKAIEENKRIIDEASEIGAPLVVLVCGADKKQSLAESRKQIQDGIEQILPYAKNSSVKLAIEPLHPMYADSRSAINTLRQANDMCEKIADEYIGVAVDVYHTWWDETLEQEIFRCGKMNCLFAFHICDWKTPTTDFLNDRGLMGEGCIPLKQIRAWMEAAGFCGYNEVEIFSNQYWQMDQDIYLSTIIDSYLQHS